MFQVEKGIPVPVRNSRGELKRQLESMQVGDSFLMPYSVSRCSSVAAGARRYNKLITMHKEGDMVRVWLLAHTRAARADQNIPAAMARQVISLQAAV